ncbi:MAG TPA: hypothetical protein VIX63_11570 [Vicinamibacterales bacterium]
MAGSLPWGALLAPLNLRVLTIVPWAVVPMAAYLWMYWKYVNGAIGSPETAAWRRECLRANPLGSDVWRIALLTGVRVVTDNGIVCFTRPDGQVSWSESSLMRRAVRFDIQDERKRFDDMSATLRFTRGGHATVTVHRVQS